MSRHSLAAAPTLNATPLIDVLLVLLVLLILTLPVATHAVKLNLPQAPSLTPPQSVIVRIYSGGEMYWNDERVATLRQLSTRFEALARQEHPPIVKVMPDRWAPYERVAQVLAAAQRSQVRGLSVAPIAD
jgi:biopolymer transport protein ExbD